MGGNSTVKSAENIFLGGTGFNLFKGIKAARKAPSGEKGFALFGALDPIIAGPQMKNIDAETKAKQDQLDNDLVQTRISAANQSIQMNNKLISTLGLASAQVGARGISGASPSFKAIQEGSIQKGHEEGRFIAGTESLQEQKLRAKSEEVTREARAKKMQSMLGIAKMVGTVFAML